MEGAHYRMSIGHSSPALAHVARGDPAKARQHCACQSENVNQQKKCDDQLAITLALPQGLEPWTP